MLASYAVEHSAGRRFPQAAHPYRNDFQRDRDRVIHSRAFRRLEAKTQVFTRRYSDHFRNRLTHTLEVAQISRTIAAQLGLNVDLVEALALAHDIGHPPFGHSGERALDDVMRQHGLFFDHNLHALRIVEDFELRYAAFRGLNLTFEVREGIVKHSRDYDPTEFPELAEYRLEERPPLEAQLIDQTDELAYNTADLDDGYEARLISLDRIREAVPVFERFFVEAERMYPDAAKKLQFNEALRQMLDRWVGDLIRNTQRELDTLVAGAFPSEPFAATGSNLAAEGGRPTPSSELAGEDARRSTNKTELAARRGGARDSDVAAEQREHTARGASPGSPEQHEKDPKGRQNLTLNDIRACLRRLVGLSPECEAERVQTKKFLHENLYFSPALEPEKEDAERVITDLFDLWMKHPEKLPASYQEKAKTEPLARIVCDYIAGMTDNYIYEQYGKYCG